MSKQKIQEWEFEILLADALTPIPIQSIQSMGVEGWQLAGVISKGRTDQYIFQRPKQIKK